LAQIALLLALFPALLGAASPYESVCGIDTFAKNDSLNFIGIALIFVSLAIALSYMYGKLSHDVKSETWAKDEAQNLLITVLLFAGLLVFFTGSCKLAEEYVGGSPFSASYSYMNRLLSSNGVSVLRDLTYGSLKNQLEATQYLFVGFTPYTGYGMAEKANYRALSSHKEFLIDLYLPIIASLNAQKYMLQMIEIVSASVLLPFAFILRLVPPTREYGNMLLALFFGLYIIVPTTYALSGVAYENLVEHPYMVSGHEFRDSVAFGSEPGGNQAQFYRLASTLPQAIFLPNLVVIMLISCVMAITKALRAIAV
jgi:hypothetical protein